MKTRHCITIFSSDVENWQKSRVKHKLVQHDKPICIQIFNYQKTKLLNKIPVVLYGALPNAWYKTILVTFH